MHHVRRSAYALAAFAGMCVAASTANAARIYGPLLMVDQRAGKNVYYAFSQSASPWIHPMANPDHTGAASNEWTFTGSRFPTAGNLRNTVFVSMPDDGETGTIVDTMGRCLTSNDTYQTVRFDICVADKVEQIWTVANSHLYRAQGRTSSGSLAFDSRISGSDAPFLSPTPIMRVYTEAFVND